MFQLSPESPSSYYADSLEVGLKTKHLYYDTKSISIEDSEEYKGGYWVLSIETDF